MSHQAIGEHCIKNGKQLVDHRNHVRAYCAKFDFYVGASDGRMTKYVYVEWEKSTGSMHGYPITLKELTEKMGYTEQ